jgi:hypothetical protein
VLTSQDTLSLSRYQVLPIQVPLQLPATFFLSQFQPFAIVGKMKAFILLLPILSYTFALPEPASAPHSLSSIPTSASSVSASPSTFTIPSTTEEQGAAPVITLAPVLPEGGVPEIQEKWHVTTYYTCVTFGLNQVDCGT